MNPSFLISQFFFQFIWNQFPNNISELCNYSFFGNFQTAATSQTNFFLRYFMLFLNGNTFCWVLTSDSLNDVRQIFLALLLAKKNLRDIVIQVMSLLWCCVNDGSKSNLGWRKKETRICEVNVRQKLVDVRSEKLLNSLQLLTPYSTLLSVLIKNYPEPKKYRTTKERTLVKANWLWYAIIKRPQKLESCK